MNKKTISIIIPAFNESDCVEELSQRLIKVFEAELKYEFECIIVENGSTDDTFEKLVQIKNIDNRFKVLKLSRNFRMDGGLTAGLSLINSDACVLMTADLQDPPEMIHKFLRKWEEGYENIYGIVSKRHGTGPIRTLNSKIFYRIIGWLTQNAIPENASDFRLLDKKVYQAVNTLEERNRVMRGLVAWVGFKSIGIELERPPRYAGKSKANTYLVLDLAFKGIFANSNFPLRVISSTGILTSFSSIALLVFFIIRWLVLGVPFNGFGTIITFVLITFGFLSFMVGILAEYIGLIYEETKKRPNYIISAQLDEN
jgi:polyisoprenyl-phosphate glycosyltransferase